VKAVILYEYDELLSRSEWVVFEDVPGPKREKPDDVIVRTGGSGVCFCPAMQDRGASVMFYA